MCDDKTGCSPFIKYWSVEIRIILIHVTPGQTLINFTYATTRALEIMILILRWEKKGRCVNFISPCFPPSALHLHMTSSHELAFGAKIK